jgi:acylphosphatase
MVRANIFAEGRVQGVGFRATAAQVARKLGLQGLVRNLRDGRVQIFLDGPREKISEFIGSVRIHEGALRGLHPKVKRMAIAFENEDDFVDAWWPYSDFEIDYSRGQARFHQE